MDNLTHSLVGGALAASGLGRRTPLATATLVIGANLPDLDAVTYLVSPDLALAFRRGWTHGVLALAVLPLLLAAAMVLWDRTVRAASKSGAATRARPGRLLFLSYLAVGSHPALDWLNTYGVRLLMPFDDRWFYGDALFIIDPWLWLLLGGALFLGGSASRRSLGWWGVLGALATLVVMAGAPAGAKILWLGGILLLAALRLRYRGGRPDRGRPLARGALALAGLYVVLTMGGSALAERQICRALAAEGVAVEEVMVGPLATSILRRDVVVVTPGWYRFGTWDWLSRPRLRLAGGERPRPAPTPVVAAALAAPSICGMAGWLRFPLVEVDEADDGWEVYVLDARYARQRRRGFGTARVRLDRRLEPVE